MPLKVARALLNLNNLIQKFPGTISLTVLLTILVAGLWPFNFLPKNKVEWLQDRDGVRFHGQGIISGSVLDQKRWQRMFQGRAITIEIRVRPAMETTSAPGIVTLFDGRTPEIFAIRQWRSHLVVWSRADDPADRKRDVPYQEIGHREAFPKDQEVFIAIASDRSGTALYINGQPVRNYPRRSLLAADLSGNPLLILGNSPDGGNQWTGDIMGLAIYNRVLKPDEVFRDFQFWVQNDTFSIKQQIGLVALYPFYERKGEMIRNVANPDEALTMPETFSPVQRKILFTQWHGIRWNLPLFQDVSVNILGFIPAGFFFAAYLFRKPGRKRLNGYVNVILLGMGLSLLIELIQAWLPTRDSSLVDVVCNTAGTVLGITGYRVWNRKG